jgi:glutathione synthase/RimK-type ligase-like ATP-grasp enzyme
MNHQIALLTCQNLPLLTPSDQKIIQHLNDLGVHAQAMVWDDGTVIWEKFDALIFRNTWDYYLKPKQFLDWLDDLTDKNITTLNPLSIIKKNIHKFYLKEMEAFGIPIIPSVFVPTSDHRDFADIIPPYWEKVVIKPAISAGSWLTQLFDTKTSLLEIQAVYGDIRKENDLIIQKFVDEIEVEGEISLVFMDRKYSHAIKKFPKSGDFRIQSQFGGAYKSFEPPESLISTAEEIIRFVDGPLLYVRVDGIMLHGKFHLMELELIEPDLYFDFVPGSQKHFAGLILSYLDLPINPSLL